MTGHDELRRKAKAATPGPWRLGDWDNFEPDCFHPVLCIYTTDGDFVTALVPDEDYDDEDYDWYSWEQVYADEVTTRLGEYIAAADPDTILAVLDELEQVQRERDGLRAQLEECDDAYRSVAGG